MTTVNINKESQWLITGQNFEGRKQQDSTLEGAFQLP